MERSMARAWRRWVGVAVLGMCVMVGASRVALAMAAMTPEEIDQACRVEIEQIGVSLELAMNIQATAFLARVNEAPEGTQVSTIFKDGAATSARIDKLFRSNVLRIGKIVDKSIARIERLEGDPGLTQDLANDAFALLLDLKTEMLYEQSGVAQRVDSYIGSKVPQQAAD